MGIVADQHHRAREGVDRLNQSLAGVDVQMVGRLVQQQEMRRVDGLQGKDQPRLLPARHLAGLQLRVPLAEPEAAQVPAQLRLRGLRPQAGQQRERGGAGIELFGLVLGDVAGPQFRCPRHAPALGSEAPGEELHEGGLAVAVGAQQGDPVVHVQAQVQPAEDRGIRGVADRQRLQRQDRRRQRIGLGKGESRDPPLHDPGDRLHAGQRLEPRLRLPRLAGLVAEAVDISLDVAPLGLLALGQRRLVFQTFAAGPLEGVVVAPVGHQLRRLQMGNASDRPVQQVPVV